MLAAGGLASALTTACCLPCPAAPGAVDFWWTHAIISDESAEGIKSTCNFSTVGPLKAGQAEVLQGGKAKKYCDEYVDQVGAARPGAAGGAGWCWVVLAPEQWVLAAGSSGCLGLRLVAAGACRCWWQLPACEVAA